MSTMKVVPIRSSRRARVSAIGDTLVGTDKLRILLVEDDVVDAKLFFWYSKRLGILPDQITVATSIEEAHEHARSDLFDLYVVDFWIGTENSADLIDHLLSDKERRVLVMSNLSPEEMVEVYKPSETLRILCKGQLGSESLTQAVRELLHPEPAPAWKVGDRGLGMDRIMDSMRGVRSVADSLDGFVAVAETELSAGNPEDAHNFILSASTQLSELKTRIQALEKLLKTRFQGDR